MREPQGTLPSKPSHPPSDPQPSILSHGADVGAADRPVRVQLFVALLLGLVLVATGLYLWRRPRAAADEANEDDVKARVLASLGADGGVSSGVPVAIGVDAGSPSGAVSTSDPRVVACQDPGPKKTPADQCDRLVPIEQALQHAIEKANSCVPAEAGGGTIEYMADVSFLRKHVGLKLPNTSRSMHNVKALLACQKAVKDGLAGVSVDGLSHAHARYKISITATYPGPVKTR